MCYYIGIERNTTNRSKIKMSQFIKMAWMFFWRISLVTAILGDLHILANAFVSLALAGVIRFVFKKTVPVFPIINLFKGNSIFRNHDGSVSQTKQNVDNTPYANKTIVEHPVYNGQFTGYEPMPLSNVSVPNPQLVASMRGVPGSGLDSAMHMGEANIKSGQIGEANFSKALSITNVGGYNQGFMDNNSIINNVNSFWSVAMPTKESISERDNNNTDIDCVLVSGDEILLVDTKFYKSGDVTYKAHEDMIYCEDNYNGNLVGQPHRMTKNMQMAQDRFKKHFPNMRVSSIVVLMPTDSGTPNIKNVYWPGNIQAVNVYDALRRAGQMSYNKASTDTEVLYKISMLIKN